MEISHNKRPESIGRCPSHKCVTTVRPSTLKARMQWSHPAFRSTISCKLSWARLVTLGTLTVQIQLLWHNLFVLWACNAMSAGENVLGGFTCLPMPLMRFYIPKETRDRSIVNQMRSVAHEAQKSWPRPGTRQFLD